MTDILEGLRLYLLANAPVSTLTSGNVYEPELPEALDDTMPVKAVVIRGGGGPAGFRQIQTNDRRINITCYGETPHLARSVFEAVYIALKRLTPSAWAHTYIHWCNESSGPVDSRDPSLQWPYTVSSWIARSSDLTI